MNCWVGFPHRKAAERLRKTSTSCGSFLLQQQGPASTWHSWLVADAGWMLYHRMDAVLLRRSFRYYFCVLYDELGFILAVLVFFSVLKS